jgi:hypothetical protein
VEPELALVMAVVAVVVELAPRVVAGREIRVVRAAMVASQASPVALCSSPAVVAARQIDQHSR